MNSSSKIVFVQSYAAPKAMAADNGIYQQVCSKFPNKDLCQQRKLSNKHIRV